MWLTCWEASDDCLARAAETKDQRRTEGNEVKRDPLFLTKNIYETHRHYRTIMAMNIMATVIVMKVTEGTEIFPLCDRETNIPWSLMREEEIYLQCNRLS